MRRLGPDEWLKLVEEYRGSELSHKEFVAKHDVSLGTFQFWLYRKARRASVRLANSDSESAPAFLPVEVVASPAPHTARVGIIEAALRSGVTVRFAAGTDTRYLAELMAALG